MSEVTTAHGVGFCNNHGDLMARDAENAQLSKDTLAQVQRLCSQLDMHLRDGHPDTMRRLHSLESWQLEQVKASQETVLAMTALRQSVEAKTEDRKLVMDRGTKITVALLAAGVALVNVAVTVGGGIWIALHQSAATTALSTLAR